MLHVHYNIHILTSHISPPPLPPPLPSHTHTGYNDISVDFVASGVRVLSTHVAVPSVQMTRRPWIFLW